MTVHNTINKIKKRLLEYIKGLSDQKENIKEYLQRLKNGDFNRLEVSIKTPTKESNKVYDLDKLKFFGKIKYNYILKKEIKETENTLKNINGMYEETNALFNKLSNYTFVKPIVDMTDFYYKLILFNEKANLDLTLNEIVDVLLLAIYETGKYYINHPKELEKIEELSKCHMSRQEMINCECIIGCKNIYEYIDCDANIIPKITFEEFINLLNKFLYKEIINSDSLSKKFQTNGYKVYRFEEIEEVLKSKYTESKTAYDIKQKAAERIKNDAIKKYKEKEEKLKESKRRHFEQMQALKELSKYYLDKKVINKCEDLEFFNILLQKAGLSEIERKLIFNSMKNHVEEAPIAKKIPNILKLDYQKEVFNIATEINDEMLKFYIEEIITADSMWNISSDEEKQELSDYVDEMINCISAVLKSKKEVRKLLFGMEE